MSGDGYRSGSLSTVDVGGTRIACTDTGAPAGQPGASTVVFGHGLLFGGWMFAPQITELRERYRCVTLDWRGQGESSVSADGYDMDTLTADAVAVIERLDVGPVHWVGLSMGGFVGQRIAARRGELVRSLTLLDTTCEAEIPARAREYGQLAAVHRAFGIGPVRGRIERLLFGPVFRADPECGRVIDEWAARLSRCRRAGVRRAVLGVARREAVTDEIVAVRVPTLVVVGSDDVVTPPSHSERIARLIPGAELHRVDDCGHTSTLEQPGVITHLLADFLR